MSKYYTIFVLLIIILFQNIHTRDKSFFDKRQYPNRKSIKGLQPDFQPIGQIIGNSVHTVAMNFVWAHWQPSLKKGTCSSNEYNFEGFCYTLSQNMINVISTYTQSEVMVTGIFYGVPSWARRSCSVAVDPIFCAPTDEGSYYYALFVKFIAFYFNGENGNGRVSDFVIHNEVIQSIGLIMDVIMVIVILIYGLLFILKAIIKHMIMF